MGRTKRRRHRKIIRNEDAYSYNAVVSLQQWMHIKYFNFKVLTYPSAGRGVIANRSILPNEELIAVPLEHMITLDVVNKSEISFIFGQMFTKPQVAIALFLVYQKHIGDLSKFVNYIRVIPTVFNNLINCSETEIECLPIWIQRTVKNKMSEVVENFSDVMKYLKDDSCEHCQCNLRDIFNFKAFLWAWSAVNTRGVYYVDDSTTSNGDIKSTASMAMAPFLDLFNHSNDADVEAKLDIQRQVYSLTTKKPFKKHEQIFIKYGAYSNLKLLVEYGFILDVLDQDLVEFSLEEILRAAKKIDPRYADISKLKYKFITMNNLNTNLNKGQQEFSWNCNGLLYILVTMDTNLAQILSKTYSSTWSQQEEDTMMAIKRELVLLKQEVLMKELAAMDKIDNPSDGFSLAKGLIRQYLRILLS